MASLKGSSVNTSDMDPAASSNLHSVHGLCVPVTSSPVKKERAVSLDRQSSLEEVRYSETSERCTRNSGDEVGEFQLCTNIVKELLENRRLANDSTSSISSQESSHAATVSKTNESGDEKLRDMSVEKESGTADAAAANKTPQKRKQTHSDSKQGDQAQGEEESSCDEEESSVTPTKIDHPHREGVTDSPTSQEKQPHVSRLPVPRLKICSHCGTVADKAKAKKCLKCQKFFFPYWAQRCKIPPCPNCHFTHKFRRFKRFLSNCKKCGFKLPYELSGLDTAESSVEDGVEIDNFESSSASTQGIPDPSELEFISPEYSETKPKVKTCSNCGTVTNNSKAKKCAKCQKFFSSYWAKRCKIPPCPSCHFTHKFYRNKPFPSHCEKCGFKLPYELIEQQGGSETTLEDGDSSSTSTRVTPELDCSPTEWNEGKTDECFENAEEKETEMAEGVEDKQDKGKGRKSGQQDALEALSMVPRQSDVVSPSCSLEDTPVVMATTRSGRAYKHVETFSASIVPSKRSTETQPPPKKLQKLDCSDENTVQTDLLPTPLHTEQDTSISDGSCVIHTSTVQEIADTSTSDESSVMNTSAVQEAADTKNESESLEDTPSHYVSDAPRPSSELTADQKLEPSPEHAVQESEYHTKSPGRDANSPHTKEPAVSTQSPSPVVTRTEEMPLPTEAEPSHLLLPQSPQEQQQSESDQDTERAQEKSSTTGQLVDQEVQVASHGVTCDDQEPHIDENVASGPSRMIDENGREDMKSESNILSTPAVEISTVAKHEVRESEIVSSIETENVTDSVGTQAMVAADVAEHYARDSDKEIEPTLPPVSQPTSEQLTLSSAVQTERGADTESERREKAGTDEVEVFTNITRSLPFLQSVLSSVQGDRKQLDTNSQSATGIKDAATGTNNPTSGGTQSLPVLFTSSLGLEDTARKQQLVSSASPSTDSSHPDVACTTSTTMKTVSTVEASALAVTSGYVPIPVTALTAVCEKGSVDMVVTESGTLPSTTGYPPLSDMTDSLMTGEAEQQSSTVQKTGKGKKAMGRDGKPLTSRKRKQPKNQEKKDETKKPRKPRAKKSKAMTVAAPSVSDEQSTAAISMLATSIAQELQRKSSLSSPVMMGQHSKHSFSQYFYSEGRLVGSGATGSSSSATGFSEDTEPSSAAKTSNKRSPSKVRDSQEPPPKKKRLAAIAPNNPLPGPAASPVGGGMGQLPLKFTPLQQLASSLRMSSSHFLSFLQTVLSTQTPNSSSAVSAGNTSTIASASPGLQNPVSLAQNFFPPLTMSFQSLAAALSNMPIATTPIRLSGTQVTARPLLPSTVTSSAQSTSTALTTTLPLSLPGMFSSLGTPGSISAEQLLAQSEASVGTQTAAKIDSLKSLVPAVSSSLSPQLLTLPNPPQLTSAPPNLASLPPSLPPPSLVSRDLKPIFQSVLSGQHPSPPPPPLTSSNPAPDMVSVSSPGSATKGVPFPVIQSNTASSYMTLPMSSAQMFTSLSFLPHNPPQSTVVSFPPGGNSSVLPSQVPHSGGGESDVQPLLISPLPATDVMTPAGSLLPPPPQLLPQPPSSLSLNLTSSSSSSASFMTSSPSLTTAPLIPSLLRPGISSVPATNSGVSGQVIPPLLPPLSHHQQKVIYTQSVTSPKVCPGPQPTSGVSSVDSNLQVLASTVQSRINEALSKTSPTEGKPQETLPSLPPPPLAPPPLTPVPPLTLVSKTTSSTHPQYILSHPPPPQKKRGVVITKLAGPLSSALGHGGDLKGNRDGSRHSSTSSLKSGDDPLIATQSNKGPVMMTGFSSTSSNVITLSPSPTGSLEEGKVGVATIRDGPHPLDQDSDKESDSYAKLMSEETLGSDGSSEGEGPGQKRRGTVTAGDGRQHQFVPTGSSRTDGIRSVKDRDKGRFGKGREEDLVRDSDKGKSSKKRRKSSSGSSGKKTQMFSVKLKDCFLHHLTWMDYRMVLLVPLGEKESRSSSDNSQEVHSHTPPAGLTDPTEYIGHHHVQEMQGQSSEGGERQVIGVSGEAGGGERRRRRKPVLKELSGYDMEEDDDDTSLPTTSSAHVPGPCFSVYELRNKLFQTLSPNAVYIYTYKNQIKSFKLPIHWVYILKRMGGMLESCHTCRLMDLEHVRDMCTHYGLNLPDTLDSLCRNELPKGRRVIDLSGIEPDSLGPLHLEEIPLCSFTEKGRPYKPKAKKNKKKWRKEEEHRSKRKAEDQAEGERAGEDGETREQESGSKSQQGSRSLLADREMIEDIKTEAGTEIEEGIQGEGEGDWGEDEKEWKEKHRFSKRSPPPLIKRPSSPISSRTKKKPCPFCGAQVLKRSKKCSACNRNFGVYTFGRKQCLFCGRVNLARMARCNECGQSLDKAPSARPKEEDESYNSSSSHRKSDFIFGVRKRRKVHSVPLAFSGCYPAYLSSSSSSYPSASKIRRSNELHSPGDGARGVHGELSGGEEMEEGGGEEMGDGGGREEGEEEPALSKRSLSSESATAKSKSKSKSTASSNPKNGGYQYGHIPWADADITVLVDERGVAKFCLQEITAKVLVGHTKAEVFEMVRDLDLPLEQGNLQLLKKLQALGLHANRSPMCKLIASEELWLLLDALQEPVPEEVHQHLENINSSTTPLLSPGNSVRTAAVVATAPLTTTTAEEEEQTKSFESTLHEMRCSDGQFISVLRKWNGEQFVCLPEMWKKYFPEVNRNHLSSALRRLELETIMPTAQQATLLRSAQVISIRGAPGRLMKLEHMQALLDDFCIPLQLASNGSSSSSNSQEPHTIKEQKQQKQPAPSTTPATVTKPVSSRQLGRTRVHSAGTHQPQAPLPPGKILANHKDMEYAQCMRDVLTAVDSSDLVALLEQTRVWAEEQAEHADSAAAELDSQLDRLGQLIHTRRDLCTVLSREMGFLNASVHGYMSEVVRLTHAEKQVLQNLDTLLNSLKISLL